MQENIKHILEIYKNSKEYQKLIIKDALNDLYNGIYKVKKVIDEVPSLEGIHMKKLIQNMLTHLKSSFTNKELIDASERIGIILKNERTDNFGDFGLFNISKEKILFTRTKTGQAIKSFYGVIEKEELEEIHYMRELFIQNLLEYKIIGDYNIQDNFLLETIEEFIEMISKKGKKGRREMRDISEMTDSFTRTNFSLIRSAVGNKKLKEWMSLFLNDMNIAGYNLKLSEIEYLYEATCDEKIAKPFSEAEFIGNKVFIRYNGQDIDFETGEKTFIIISAIYNSENKGDISLMDIFPKIYPGEEYSAKYKSNEKRSISNTIAGINRRFRKISDGKNLMQFKNNTVTKLI